ncbi:hypothetical protein CR513_02248, partial [Mucuna pruriens]
MKEDVNQVKEQMSKILEVLQAMKGLNGNKVNQPQATPSHPPGHTLSPQAHPSVQIPSTSPSFKTNGAPTYNAQDYQVVNPLSTIVIHPYSPMNIDQKIDYNFWKKDLVVIRERVEAGVKNGKIAHMTTTPKRPRVVMDKKKIGETNAIDLIDRGWLSFKENTPNVRENPLLRHGCTSINAINGNFDSLIREGLMDSSIIQISWSREEKKVLMTHYERGTNPPKPVVTHFTKNAIVLAPSVPKSLIVKIPMPFPFKDSRAVPWKCGVKVQTKNNMNEQLQDDLGEGSAIVTNLTGIGGIMRSEQIYTQEVLRKGKENMAEGKEGEIEADKTIVEEGEKNKKVSDEEAMEFLKIVQQSKGIVSNIIANNHFTFTDEEIAGKEDIMVMCPTPFRYIEAAEEAFEIALESLEVNITASEESLSKNLCPSKAAIMVAKVMLGGGYQPGERVGKELNGIIKPIEFPENKN